MTPTTDSPEQASSVDDESTHPSQISVEITGVFSLATGHDCAVDEHGLRH